MPKNITARTIVNIVTPITRSSVKHWTTATIYAIDGMRLPRIGEAIDRKISTNVIINANSFGKCKFIAAIGYIHNTAVIIG